MLCWRYQSGFRAFYGQKLVYILFGVHRPTQFLLAIAEPIVVATFRQKQRESLLQLEIQSPNLIAFACFFYVTFVVPNVNKKNVARRGQRVGPLRLLPLRLSKTKDFVKNISLFRERPDLPRTLNVYPARFLAFIYQIVVVVGHIYPPVTRQRQTLTIERSAHFLLQ